MLLQLQSADALKFIYFLSVNFTLVAARIFFFLLFSFLKTLHSSGKKRSGTKHYEPNIQTNKKMKLKAKTYLARIQLQIMSCEHKNPATKKTLELTKRN